MRAIYPGLSLLALVLASQGCLIPSLASVGTIPVVDDTTARKVDELGDPELSADVHRLPKAPRAGTGEYYAALCIKTYVDARYAEHRLAAAPAPSPADRSRLEGETMGFGNCASTCKAAYTQVQSSYSDLAQKYQPRCEQAFAARQSQMVLDGLAAQVDAFRKADTPLKLYYADHDSEQALAQASQQVPAGNARLAQLADDIRTLGAQHAAEIRKAESFLDTPAARENTARRESLSAEIDALDGEIQAARDDQSRNPDHSLDAYMAKRRQDDQLRAKQRELDAKRSELDGLRQDFDRLASRAGV